MENYLLNPSRLELPFEYLKVTLEAYVIAMLQRRLCEHIDNEKSFSDQRLIKAYFHLKERVEAFKPRFWNKGGDSLNEHITHEYKKIEERQNFLYKVLKESKLNDITFLGEFSAYLDGKTTK